MTTKTSLILSHLKIHTELSISKVIFYEIVLCHVKYMEVDASPVGKTSGKTAFLPLVMVRENV